MVDNDGEIVDCVANIAGRGGVARIGSGARIFDDGKHWFDQHGVGVAVGLVELVQGQNETSGR